LPRLSGVVGLIVLCGLLLTGCSFGGAKTGDGNGAAPSGKLKVVASIYPVYDFAKHIGGDKAEVSCLVPPGAEPHDWEPSPKDIIVLQRADVFVYCGAGMEQWVAKALENIDQTRLLAVDAGKNVELLTGSGQYYHRTAGSETGEAALMNTANVDPHIWLDPLNAAVMVENITAALVKADPANQSYYERNAAAYRGQLMALHKEYQAQLGGAKGKSFVTSHAAFGYLAKRYGLIQLPLRGLSPEAEPTPARMAEVVQLVREEKIRYIFFESLVSPKVSEVIAAETGAGTLVLNPLDGLTAGEIAGGADYLTVMRENLVNLQRSFGLANE